MNIGKWLRILIGSVFVALPCLPALGAETRLGVLQGTVENAARARAAGLDLAVLELSWDRFEPKPGSVDPLYVAELREKIRAFREAKQEIILEFGIQYPPAWVFASADSRYRNQFGAVYEGRGPGKNVANSVFSTSVRIRQAAYVQQVFMHLGVHFFAVRIGGGWFGELTFPEHKFAGQENCYWAYDVSAQGERPGLAEGLAPCPVPGWRPGEASPDYRSAELFLHWYQGALENYLLWQIGTVRSSYQGRIMVLFPSWGIRPGQAEAAIAGDLSGRTPPEINGEIARGVDFARQIRALRDPNVIVHCTWLDADPSFGAEPPIHYLAALARGHDPPLPLSAENTGGGGQASLDLCARRAQEFSLSIFLWAFEPDLFDGQRPEVEDLGKAFGPSPR